MTAFKFVDYDPRSRSRCYIRDAALIREFADALRGNPGVWAEFPVPSKTNPGARMLASRINRGEVGAPMVLRGCEFEATCRGGVVYVRYGQEGNA